MSAVDSVAAAVQYLERGFCPLPLPRRGKNPQKSVGRGWPDFRADPREVDRDFAGKNVGLLLGEPSGGLVDIDLDCDEAVELAPQFLPETDAVFGRSSRRRSHWLYSSPAIETSVKYKDPDGQMLVEVRTTGCQTVVPPSLHPSGEQVSWDAEGEPKEVEAPSLMRAAAELASATLLARYWPKEGSRNEAALALAGSLVRSGWDDARIVRLLLAAASAAGDEEHERRAEVVRPTRTKIEAGQEVTGWPTLVELAGEKAVASLRKWMGLRPVARDTAGGDIPFYRSTPYGFVWDKPTKEGRVPVQLTNFNARVVKQVCEDNGVEQTPMFEVEVTLDGSTKTLDIPAHEFASMSWVVRQLGIGAIVFPGPAVREHARTAIQLTSKDAPRYTVYTHTGWTNHEEHGLVYLHSAGAIGSEGRVEDVEVRLPPNFDRCDLPTPDGATLGSDLEMSLGLLDLAPDTVMVPLLAAVFRTLVAGPNVSIHITGYTGTFKSQVATLVQSFWGSTFDDQSLPGSWSSTANALEVLGFLGKDQVVVVDDFAPNGTTSEVQALHSKAERILRAQGNGSARNRLTPDARLRRAQPPRGMYLSTGEEIPNGHSVQARVVILELTAGAVDKGLLTSCQNAGRQGCYARVTSSFLMWVASRRAVLLKRIADRVPELRDEIAAVAGHHRRTPTNIAELFVGIEILVEFCAANDLLSEDERQQLRDRCWQALTECARSQAEHLHSANPTTRFVSLLRSALGSGDAHLAGSRGEVPPDGLASACGWETVAGKRESDPPSYRAKGSRIGWLEGEDVYLDLNAAWKAAQAMAAEGDRIPIGPRTLAKRLEEARFLKSVDEGRKKHLIRRVLQGSRRNVLHLDASVLGFGAHRAHRARRPTGGAGKGIPEVEAWARNGSEAQVGPHGSGPSDLGGSAESSVVGGGR